MAEVNVFIDGETLAQATAVYTDSSLTTLAADAYYSDLSITREQLNGKLGAAVTCPTCSGSPAAGSTSTVTQNVVDNIVGTLGVDYTLSGSGYDGGDPPGAVADTEENDYPYDFVIEATPASGKEFSDDAPFNATNPSGTVPSGGETVTNTLSGTIVPIPEDKMKYYFVEACAQGAQASKSNLLGPDKGFLFKAKTSPPVSGQRFVTTNTTPAEYYVYTGLRDGKDKTIAEFAQIDSLGVKFVFNTLPENIGKVLQEIPGELDCPTDNSSTNFTNQYIYRLRSCTDNRNDYYYTSLVSETTNRRVMDDAGEIFIIEERLKTGDLATLTEKTGVLLVDINGFTSTSVDFEGPIEGCPTQNVLLKYCGSSPGGSLLNLSLAVAVQAPNDPLFTSGLIGEVYLDSEGVCWTVQLLTDEGVQLGKGIPPRNLTEHISGGCQSCTNPKLIYSDLQ